MLKKFWQFMGEKLAPQVSKFTRLNKKVAPLGGFLRSKLDKPKRVSIYPSDHILHNFPPEIDDSYLIGSNAAQQISSAMLDKISSQVQKQITEEVRAQGDQALKAAIDATLKKHLSPLLTLLSYIRNNINDHDLHEKEKIILVIDMILADPKWSKYLEASKPEPGN